MLGLIEESTKYANLLGYNHGSSEWYKASYKIFNKDYIYNEKKNNKINKINKKKLLTEFKTKFKKVFNVNE